MTDDLKKTKECFYPKLSDPPKNEPWTDPVIFGVYTAYGYVIILILFLTVYLLKLKCTSWYVERQRVNLQNDVKRIKH
jgi:hypothetical protein